MAGDDATTKFFEAVNEGSDALIDAVRAVNDRSHRLTTAVLQEAQEGQREMVELAKRWGSSPFDLLGLYGSLVENTTKTQGRMLDVMRQWFGEMADVQKETRETLQRLVKANRHAGEATIELARGVFTRTSDVMSTATNGDGRRARETAKSASEN